jgi:uncharacterized protein YciI
MLFVVDARIREGADIQPLLEAELAAVNALREEGFIEQLFRRLDDTGAWLVVDAPSAEEAQQRLDALPFVVGDVMTMTLSPSERL